MCKQFSILFFLTMKIITFGILAKVEDYCKWHWSTNCALRYAPVAIMQGHHRYLYSGLAVLSAVGQKNLIGKYGCETFMILFSVKHPIITNYA